LDITPAAEAVIHAAGASSPDCWLKHLPVE
jgi:hypothetical protein